MMSTGSRQPFSDLLARHDLVVVTGGLGPTADDVTRDGVALALDRPIRHSDEVERWIRDRYAARGREMPVYAPAMARVIEGSRLLLQRSRHRPRHALRSPRPVAGGPPGAAVGDGGNARARSPAGTRAVEPRRGPGPTNPGSRRGLRVRCRGERSPPLRVGSAARTCRSSRPTAWFGWF